MKKCIIDLQDVSCKVGYRYLLKNITWQVQKGEHWVIFGMNGSGKTTLLSIIAGFKQETEGIVKIFGSPFTNDTVLSKRRKIGWVSVSFFDNQYKKESVLQIVLSGKSGTLGVRGTITLEDVRLAKYLLRELQLGDKIDYPFYYLSKGERQNVLIARALISDPEILILDEPCTGLDLYNRSHLFSTIELLAEKKKITILYVTHYAEEVLPLFQKTLLMKSGKLFAQGETKELFTNEMMTRLLGYPVQVEKMQNQTYRMHVQTTSSLVGLLEKERS